MFRWLAVIAFACVLVGAGALTLTRDSAAVAGRPVATRLHYAANGNVAVDGHYLPGRYGFNLADVSSPAELTALPPGVLGLVYLGSCAGADPAFTALVGGFSGNPKLFGFYLLDEPDPATCAPANLKSESTYIHEHIAGARTFILEQNLAASTSPSYTGGYNPANTGIDLFGIDPYPCRTELHGCDPSMIARYVVAAERFGIPAASIVPVYQEFGGGAWIDDGGGHYQLPTAAQTKSMLDQWTTLIPDPVFDFVYSWGSQRADTGLSGAPADVLAVFAAHNAE